RGWGLRRLWLEGGSALGGLPNHGVNFNRPVCLLKLDSVILQTVLLKDIRRRSLPMPMIDVYAVEGTFSNKHAFATDLAAAVMRWEKVPNISLFRNNTAAFILDLPADSLSNVAGESNYVRVQVLTPVGVLDRDKQLGVVRELTDIVAAAAGDPK